MPDTKQELNDSPQGEAKTTHDVPESAVSAVPTEDVAQGEEPSTEPVGPDEPDVSEDESQAIDPDSIAGKIEAVIRERKNRLPEVVRRIEAICKLQDAMKTIESTLAASDSANETEAQPLLEMFYAVAPLTKIKDMLQVMKIVESRFKRGTINIGVSGQARVGKSTLLQSLSGLGDEQIPTGAGLPVTAVRSQIEHSKENTAYVKFHSWDSFRDEVLQPYYKKIGLVRLPSTPEEFLASPPDKSFEQTEGDVSEKRTLLQELKVAHECFGQYRSLLSGREDKKPLEQISEYVRKTYDDHGKPVNMKYLAVKEVRILCVFPDNEVQKLVLVDLPGLGEISPGGAERHRAGLERETDLVVMVKRPDSSQGCDWSQKDAHALDLAERARGDMKRTSDFLFLLKNVSPDSNAELVQDLSKALEHKVNATRAHDPLTILTADVKTREGARKGVLEPVLSHLAERLGEVDKEILDTALEKVRKETDGLKELIFRLDQNITPDDADMYEEINDRAKVMPRYLAAGLNREVLRKLDNEVQRSNEDLDYIEMVNDVYNDSLVKLESGYYEDRDAWVEDLALRLDHEGDSGGIAVDEVSRIRVELSRQFSGIDRHFNWRVDELIESIAAIFIKHTGELLSGAKASRSGRAALEYFMNLCVGAKANVVASALSDLLSLKIEYKTHLHPKARQELARHLRAKRPNLNGTSGSEAGSDVVYGEVSREGAEQMAKQLQELGSAASDAMQVKILEEGGIQKLILYAAAEQFVDALVRSGESEKQFQRIVKAYFHDMWPDDSKGLKARSVRNARLQSALNESKTEIVELEGENNGNR